MNLLCPNASLTKSFAEMHGGYLAIESEYGVGTTVSIYLPVPTLPADARPAAVSAPMLPETADMALESIEDLAEIEEDDKTLFH